MPLNWNDDDEEELTEIDYKKKPSRVLVHEEITSPLPEENLRTKTGRPTYVSPSPPPSPILKNIPPPVVQPTVGTYTPAPLRDRFVAFLMDTLIGLEIYFIVGYLLMRFFKIPTLHQVHQNPMGLWFHILGTMGAMLLYYVLMEGSIGATLGKICCRLRVVEENGQKASAGNVLIRNLLRLIDYPLAFLVAIITMESSPWHQRLGDRAAKTVVIKKSRSRLPTVDLNHTPLGSTLSRIFAEIADLVLSLTLLYGFLLMMSPQHPYLAWVMYLQLPIVFIFYYTLLEFFTGTTPGKSLFKRQVILENGESPDFTSALLRNLFRPLDYALGYLLMTLSKKKQRLGDMAAETLVIAKPCGKKGGASILLALSLMILVCFFGFKNKNNFITKDYGLSPAQGWRIFIPKLRPPQISSDKQGTAVPQSPNSKKNNSSVLPTKNQSGQNEISTLPQQTSPTNPLKLAEFYFANGPQPGQIRNDGVFKKGDLIFAFFKIQGYKLDAKKQASLTEDLQVENPRGDQIIIEKNIVNYSKVMKGNNQNVLFGNQLKIPKDSPEGRYRAIFIVHDLHANTQYVFEKLFEIQ